MELFPREKYLERMRSFYDADDLIKVITGIRRCGKSCLMQTIVAELRSRGVKEENIIFIDLDKRGYGNIRRPEQLETIIEGKTHVDGLKYVFIDEIQNVDGFENVINGFRNEGNYSIFITGSNSYLLSGELVTKLTGRYIEFELYPLTLDEFIEMKQFYGKSLPSDRQDLLNQYILEGGFPRSIFFDELFDKHTYVQSIITEIFAKDIKKRIKIRDKDAFERVQNYIINNFAATTSIVNLCNAMKQSGITVSRPTVTRYIQVLVDAKILIACDRFDMKSKKSLSGEKKYYLSDLSFYYAMNTDSRINYGPVLENIVCLYAKSMNYKLSIGRIGKLECDFILRNTNMEYSYIQVAYTILSSRDTEDREYRSLEAIKDNYAKYVMTMDGLIQKRNGIIHVNILDFMRKRMKF